MARKRKEKGADAVGLAQPDRTGPTEETLLQLAQERGLFEQVERRQDKTRQQNGRPGSTEGGDEDAPGLSPAVERIADTILWSLSLSMLHFTLDVLVQHQYAVSIVWSKVAARSGQALLVFILLFYVLHRHGSNPILLPGLPARFQNSLRQAIFLITSAFAGCYLIYTTNRQSYLAVMKQAPSLGCLWVWSVIELDLSLALLSLAIAGVFMWQGGYDFS